MAKSTKMGMNRTGAQMSPQGVKQMQQWSDQAAIDTAQGEEMLAAIRNDYLAEADPVGSIPLPGTVKGATGAVVGKIKGKNPEVLLDKIGERIAFERTGTRLYQLFLQRLRAGVSGDSGIPIDQVEHFYVEEARHFKVASQAMESLGGDPTAQTPCADSTGVASMGILQVLSDPRSTIPQCLSALLSAELIDNAGWELLVSLAQEVGHDELVEPFQIALQEEMEHRETVQSWLEEAVLKAAT